MHLLLAALLEGQQTHSETVNEKGVWAAGEVELKVMYILVRAGILQTWHDVLDLCVTYIFISFKKSYEWGGERKGKRVLEVQCSIFFYFTLYMAFTQVYVSRRTK